MQQVSDKETEIILDLAEKALKVEGDFVELGCYKGDTSILLQKLLHKNGFDRRLFLYDSFEGLPERTKEDASVAGDGFRKGELLVTKKEVVLKFKKAGLPVPKIKKAFFEDLSGSDLPEKIAFAFLDGDLYSSIKTSLDLVLPQLSKNGVLLVHDYNNPSLPGAARAVDERGLKGSLRETLFLAQ
ncbi:class I SAM-dependent methyltransferase [Candidatus Saccharibacteria bacterium]|nr:class I SAM-dependent methyltransferase [Candidatus Saccharibacteria bacterium]